MISSQEHFKNNRVTSIFFIMENFNYTEKEMTWYNEPHALTPELLQS